VTARLIVLGRQGAGKGTQCARLASRLGIPHVSTGDLFRAEIAADTSLGRRLADYVEQGALVPDDVVLDVVSSRLGDRAARADGYLLDGFPRTLAQAQALFEVLGAGAADVAVEIHVPTRVVLERLANRVVCERCGCVGSAETGQCAPPCPSCAGRMVRRSDDNPEAIARRLALYDEQAGPLLIWFDSQGLLVSVDGVGDADEVQDRFLGAVAQRVPGLTGYLRRSWPM
jgi:adenylate kinase